MVKHCIKEVINVENVIEDTPKEDSNKLMLVGVAIAIVAVLGIVFFATRGSDSKTAIATTRPTQQAATVSPVIAANTKEVEGTSTESAVKLDASATQVTVEAGSFYYKPNTIKVKKGEKIQIVMKSVDMMHDFKIDELNVHLPITKSGQTNTVIFTADTVGKFEYYCSVGQHRKNGQVGTIEVTN